MKAKYQRRSIRSIKDDKRIYPEADTTGTPSKKLGRDQTVRIVKWKDSFDKGYIPNWTKEHFTVKKTLQRPIPVYNITDTQGEDIQGVYYKQELQPSTANEYTVEKVVRRRKTSEEDRTASRGPCQFQSWLVR